MSEIIDKAIEKLTKEIEKTSNASLVKPVAEYLIERVKESESLAEDVCQEHKALSKCAAYIMEKAKKELGGKSGAIIHTTVYEWAEDYYRLDDKALEEKKAKEEAERKAKKAEEAKKRAEEKPEKEAVAKNTTTNKKAEKKEAPAPAEKKPKGEMDGQMDLFSFLS